MASTDGTHVDPDTVDPDTEEQLAKAEVLNSIFGALRAEYFREEVFDLFTHPAYFPQLQTMRPCLLVGGRGTGKTTVLKCMSYEGQERLLASTPVENWLFMIEGVERSAAVGL